MRGFLTRDVRAAVGHSLGGSQALHLHTLGVGKAAPGVFRAAVARGEWVAHLFDRDAARLRRTAAALGVRVVVIDRPGEPAQHIDLCGEPLRRALLLCDNADTLPARPGAAPAPGAVELPPELAEEPEYRAELQGEWHPPDFEPEPPFALPPALAGETSGANYAAAYTADQHARPTRPPRPAEEMRFGNMGTMSKPNYPTVPDDAE